MVHTGSPEEIMDSLKAGADSIEHGLLPGADSSDFGDDIVSMMLARKTYFVPTMAIAWTNKEAHPEVFSGLKRAVNRLHDVGINIAAGTDSGTPGVVIGKGLHKELELLVEAGLSPMEALIAGTRNAADNLGRVNGLGTIEKGKLENVLNSPKNLFFFLFLQDYITCLKIKIDIKLIPMLNLRHMTHGDR